MKRYLAAIFCMVTGFNHHLFCQFSPEITLWSCPDNPQLQITYRYWGSELEIFGPQLDSTRIEGTLMLNNGSFRMPDTSIFRNGKWEKIRQATVTEIQIKMEQHYFIANLKAYCQDAPQLSFLGHCVHKNTMQVGIDPALRNGELDLIAEENKGNSPPTAVNNVVTEKVKELRNNIVEQVQEELMEKLQEELIESMPPGQKQIVEANKKIIDAYNEEVVEPALQYIETEGQSPFPSFNPLEARVQRYMNTDWKKEAKRGAVVVAGFLVAGVPGSLVAAALFNTFYK